MSRRARLVAATSAALLISLLGGTTAVLFNGHAPQQPAALQPVPAKAPEPETAPDQPSPDEPTLDLSAGLGSGSDLLGGADAASGLGSGSGGAGSLLGGGAMPAVLPGGGSPAALPPAPSLPVFQFPAPPALPPAAPTIDWQTALAPYIQSQMNATAANLAGSITGTAVGSTAGALNSAAVAAGDLLLFANYVNNNNPSVLSQLQSALPAAAPAVAALEAGNLPDFSGLSSAFAAVAAQPPVGVPTPQLPQLPPPPNLPTPEQVAAALAVPAVGLPALAIPALPPPPPIGLPPLPPPPPFGFPSFGLPSFEFPSITRLLGLPF